MSSYITLLWCLKVHETTVTFKIKSYKKYYLYVCNSLSCERILRNTGGGEEGLVNMAKFYCEAGTVSCAVTNWILNGISLKTAYVQDFLVAAG